MITKTGTVCTTTAAVRASSLRGSSNVIQGVDNHESAATRGRPYQMATIRRNEIWMLYGEIGFPGRSARQHGVVL